MSVGDDVVEVKLDAKHRSFEIFVNGAKAGQARFRDSAGVRTFTHTEIHPQYEGRGLGGRLIREALDYTWASELGVVPQCPFVRAFIDRHPEYAEIVVAAQSPTP
jgi:predicted GNAT family acetyltransferase